ncbi:MAG: beta-ketoacyl-ACP synthase II [Anaerolineae bacterium]|nr:beta-ketoacyl-ACP synthase II [Anaerolineae bacterium]
MDDVGKKRVVVTGLGVVSPVGLDAGTMWRNLVEGRSGIRPITQFDASDLDVRFAGEAHGFDPLCHMPAKEARRTDRFAQFAIAALDQALAQSGLAVDEGNADQVGVIVGAGIGGITTYTRDLDVLREKGPRHVNPFLLTMISADVPAVQIALRTGARGPNLGVSSACATGADAIGQAYNLIRLGEAQVMLAGGFEAGITRISISVLQRMRALSRRNDDPASASRPFDAERDGFVVSEGGALLVLEDLEFALARGAQPLAELVGYAATSDAVHVTAPDPEGHGSAQCMALALRRAGIEPEQVSYVNAHGTGTPLGDPAETAAIKRALGAHARRVPVSATKSMTGHLMGGAGALEAAICVQALRHGLIPPTINLDTPDPACDLDYVPHYARRAALDVVLSNSFGFGGHNTALVLRAWDGAPGA